MDKKKKIISTSLFLFNDQYFVVGFRGNFGVIIMTVYQKLKTTQSYWYAAWMWVHKNEKENEISVLHKSLTPPW